MSASPSREEEAPPWEAFQMEESLWKMLPARFKYVVGGLLAAGVLVGLAWWLFQT